MSVALISLLLVAPVPGQIETPDGVGAVDSPLPADEVAPEVQEVKEVPREEGTIPGPSVPQLLALCPVARPCVEGGPFAVWPRFRLRAGYEFVQPDAEVPFIGNNDGFLLDQARLGMEGTYLGRVDFRLVFDAISTAPGGGNDPVRDVFGATRDAWVRFNAHKYLQITVGQIFLPVDREGQMARDDMVFAYRSVATDGLRAGRGFAVNGLSAGREVGLQLGAQDVEVGDFVLDYRLAVSTGNGQNKLGNDNKLPALTTRVAAGYKDLISVGLTGRYNPRTVGELPNLFNETDLQGGVDFMLSSFGIEVLAQAVIKQTSFDTVFLADDPSRTDTALGLTSWVTLNDPFGVPLYGFRPGFRFSYLDPKGAFPDDQVLELTTGIRYDPPTELPLFLTVDFTMLFEPGLEGGDSTRSVDNHRLTALLQFDL